MGIFSRNKTRAEPILEPIVNDVLKENNNKVMLCALDYKEKSYWVSILKYYTH